MIDLVTVVFKSELESLRLQAKSVALYVKDVDSIFVVVNQDSACRIDTRWWGECHHKVTVLHRDIFGHVWDSNGWVTQQALKVLAAAQCGSDWAVILDAKTIFVTDFAIDTVKPQVGALGIYPVFEASRDIANALFGVDLEQQLGPGGVPFVINTKQAREMTAWIEQHTGEKFSAWFQRQGRLTEFILYSAWILYRTGSLSSMYDTTRTSIAPVNVCHSEVARFDHKLREMPDATTVSIHRNAWSQLTKQQQQSYLDFLHSRGIQ